MNEKGLTLVQLGVTALVIGIITACLLPFALGRGDFGPVLQTLLVMGTFALVALLGGEAGRRLGRRYKVSEVQQLEIEEALELWKKQAHTNGRRWAELDADTTKLREALEQADYEYDMLMAETEKLRERLLERNNVHRRLVKLREALEDLMGEQVTCEDAATDVWCSTHQTRRCRMREVQAKALQALEGESHAG